MNLKNPIIIDDIVYDKATINLAVSTNYANGVEDLNIALRVIPTRVDEQSNIVQLNEQSYTFYRGKLTELKNESENICVNKIKNALQEFINNGEF